MSSKHSLKFKIGKITIDLHHGAWWAYSRENKKPVRFRIAADWHMVLTLDFLSIAVENFEELNASGGSLNYLARQAGA